MSISEEDRRALFDELATTIGIDNAGTLMELIPRSPSGELATRTDVQAETIMLRGEMAELRADLVGQMADLRTELRGEMADLRTELRGEMAELRSNTTAEIAGLRTHVDDRLNALITSQAELVEQMGALRHDLAGWLLTAWLSMVGAMIALVVVMTQLN